MGRKYPGNPFLKDYFPVHGSPRSFAERELADTGKSRGV